MSELDSLLNQIKQKAVKITERKLGKGRRNVITLTIAILSEIYSLEYLFEQYLRVTDELARKQQLWGRNSNFQSNQSR